MDVEKTIEFILEQQARFAARMDRVEGQLETLTRVVGQQQGQITTILGAISMLAEQVSTLTQRVDTLTQRVDTLTQRVDALARMFEEWLRRSGDGSGRS